MRFDDRLLTVLANRALQPSAAASKWRQLVDLVAQANVWSDTDGIARALMEINSLRDEVPEPVRCQALRALKGRLRSAPLIRMLSLDSPAICSAAISSARLDDQEWAELIPELSSRARGFLRNRNDLGRAATDVLNAWVSADFRLSDGRQPAPNVEPLVRVAPPAQAEQASHVPSELPRTELPTSIAASAASGMEAPRPISELVARIEEYRRQRTSFDAPQLPLEEDGAEAAPAPALRFAFVTDDIGTVIDTAGLPRGAIVGTSIAEPAYDDGPGPDAYAASAFRQRVAISQGRMRLCGSALTAGEWRINARPVFDPASGRFRGYRGLMRRPTAAEDVRPDDSRTEQAEYVQQIIHELRSPLNAIIGFSEIIEQQLFGPVSSSYRDLASSILHDARRLLAGFDDISLAARIERGETQQDDGTSDPDWLIDRIAERLHSLTDARHVELNITKAEPLRTFAQGPEQLERIYSRLLSAIILACDQGERLDATLKTRIGTTPQNCLTVSLPQKLVGRDESELLEAGNDQLPDCSDVPLLGLGFSLRLVRSLAHSAGGSLRFHNSSVLLSLPAVAAPRNGERGHSE